MNRFTLAFFNRVSTNPSPPTNLPSDSDIVSLLNLPRAISEYTNEHIGEIISIPYTDESGKILLNNGCIEFEVVGVNHHKDINDESKPTITLMTKNIIRCAAFDAKEPNNTEYTLAAGFGNSRWSVSNIRQWLNSESGANEWFTPQHEYDTAPTTDKVNGEAAAYTDDPGFLTGFSNEIKQHFATVKNKTILSRILKITYSKDFEETEDKVFLPSYTEMGFGNFDDNNPEGSHLDKMFRDDNSRIKSGGDGDYWMRTPYTLGNPPYVCSVNHVTESGKPTCILPISPIGVAPILVLC